MRQGTRPFFGFVVAAACVLLGACTDQQPVVGILQPLSGTAGIYGHSIDGGIQLALAEAERSTQLPEGFTLVRVDTGSDPNRAVTEYRRLVAEKGAKLVLGGVTTEEAYALLPEVDEARIICLSPAVSAKDISRRSPYFYRLYPTDEAEGQATASHLYKTRLVRRVLVYTDDSQYTRGVESEFRQHFQLKLTGRIVDTVHLNIGEWQRRSTDLLHAYHPDAVFIIGYADRIIEVLQHLQGNGFDGVRSTTSTFFVTDVISRAGKLADEVVFPLPAAYTAPNNEQVAAFSRGFQERFGCEPDIFAAHGYDAMHVALDALSKAERLYTSEIRKAMSFRLDLVGLTGAIAFDDHGDVKRYPTMHIFAYGQVMTWEQYRDRRLKELRDKLMKPASCDAEAAAARPVSGAVA